MSDQCPLCSAPSRSREQLQLYASLTGRTAELEQLAELSQRVNEAVRLEDVLPHLYDGLRGIIPYNRIGLALLDDAGEQLTLHSMWSDGSITSDGIDIGFSAQLKGSPLQDMLNSGEPRIIHDLEDYSRTHPASESASRILRAGVLSSMTFPLRAFGKPIGALFFSSFEKNAYDESHARFFRQIAGQISLVVTKSKLYEDLLETKARLEEANRELEAIATADPLTGIANRRLFDSALATEWRRATRSRLPISLLMVDVDYFKAFNDNYGHLAGDNALRLIATSLAAMVGRPGDLAARYGGEEFAVLLPETPLDVAKTIAEDLRKSIAGLAIPHEYSSVSPLVSVSIGVATAVPVRGARVNDLIHFADKALYVAKAQGRNRISPGPAEETHHE
jgi:diguanylate cyclase (GGDEF)-like protein